jgi:hypothetical protein
MKSGKKIYARVLLEDDRMAAIRALGNGDLRSLLLHIARQGITHTETGGLLYGMAHVSATERFLAKGKGKGL